MLEIDGKRKDEIDVYFKTELESIEKEVYEEFKRIIDLLKNTEMKYLNENSRLCQEVNNLKKENVDLCNCIKDLYEKLVNIKRTIGRQTGEDISEIVDEYN